jgi:YD repeat-containing protein
MTASVLEREYRNAVFAARPSARLARVVEPDGSAWFQVRDGAERLSSLHSGRIAAWRDAEGVVYGSTLPYAAGEG